MKIFVVRHQHEADTCPATDFTAGAELLNHLTRVNAARYGVRIHGEAVLGESHTLMMIAEAAEEDDLRRFLKPLQAVGSLEVTPAATCAKVVASGGCAASIQARVSAAMPTLDPLDRAVDPAEACQLAIDAGLVVHRAHPLNAETSIPALIGSVVMPNAHFYVRNHFQIPDLHPSAWRLNVVGAVERPLALSLSQLQAMPSQSAVVTLECAGNGRAMLDPPIPGEPWGLGAVSTAEWSGVSAMDVLDRARLKPSARELVFRGADGGNVEGRAGVTRFARSLAIDQLRDSGALLAFAMNGEALPIQHGYPLRLIVPGWYAVASVKWLTQIEVAEKPFTGYFQDDKYQYERKRDGRAEREPVTLQRVRSLIVEPSANQSVDRGETMIRGVAWSGTAPIKHVDVSVGGGPWQPTALIGDRQSGHWQWWQLVVRLDTPGPVTVRAKATDLVGRTQPDRPPWNAQGYGNNVIQEIAVTVRSE